MQLPERFTLRRLQTRPYASMKCLLCEYSTSSITGPIVRIGWNRSHSIGRISRRMDGVLAKMYVCCQVERGKRLGTLSVPTEDTLGSMGEVGVEILDRNVVSEVTVS